MMGRRWIPVLSGLVLVGCVASPAPSPSVTVPATIATPASTSPTQVPTVQAIIDDLGSVPELRDSGDAPRTSVGATGVFLQSGVGEGTFFPASGDPATSVLVDPPSSDLLVRERWFAVQNAPAATPAVVGVSVATVGAGGLKGSSTSILFDYIAEGEPTHCEVALTDKGEYQIGGVWLYEDVMVAAVGRGDGFFTDAIHRVAVNRSCETLWKNTVERKYTSDMSDTVMSSDGALAYFDGRNLISVDVSSGERLSRFESGLEPNGFDGSYGPYAVVSAAKRGDDTKQYILQTRTLDLISKNGADEIRFDPIGPLGILSFTDGAFTEDEADALEVIDLNTSEVQFKMSHKQVDSLGGLDVLGAYGGQLIAIIDRSVRVADSTTGDPASGWETSVPGKLAAANIPVWASDRWVLLTSSDGNGDIERVSSSENFEQIVRSAAPLTLEQLPAIELSGK